MNPPVYAPVLIRLLQGVVYDDDSALWALLAAHQTAIRDYFAQLGLRLVYDDKDRYAYLYQPGADDEEGVGGDGLPRLTRRYTLSYDVTLLLVLLRQELERFDREVEGEVHCTVAMEGLFEQIQPFYPVSNDERKLRAKFRADLNTLEGMGYVKQLRGDGIAEVLVRPILRTRLSAEQLRQLSEQLRAHARSEKDTFVNEGENDDDDNA